MLRISKYLSRFEIVELVVGLLSIIGQIWFNLELPDYMADITTLVETPGSNSRDIWTAGAKMLLISLGAVACAVVTGFIAARVAASFTRRLRSMEFRRVESFGPAEMNRFSTASLITRSTNDITQIQMFITMGLLLMVMSPIMAVWAVLKIAGKGFEWTLATGITVAILLIIIALLMWQVMPKFRSMQRLTDDINLVARENLTGLRVVRAYNAESFQERKFERANDALTETQLFTNRVMAVMMPLMNTIMNGLMLAVYWIGAYLIQSAGMADKLTLFSNMVVFSSYAVQVIMSFLLMSMVFVLLPRADVSAKRVLEVLDTVPAITDPTQDPTGDSAESAEDPIRGTVIVSSRHRQPVSSTVPAAQSVKGGLSAEGIIERPAGQDDGSVAQPSFGSVEFRDVSFSYPGSRDAALSGISFRAEPGQTVAFIGSTGAGKTTLVNLIPRFYDVTEGSVLVDGKDVREYRLKALRDEIGFVPQKSILFKGTVSSNISYGDGLLDEQAVRSAAKVAQADGFISDMDDSYGSPISQGGANVSGGQKQRLSIARAVYRHPEILIFDDSFSALDFSTDLAVREALAHEAKGATKLIVAQRIGTIMHADLIVVLDEGRVVGLGSHEQLLESCGVYQQIAQSQLSKAELGA